MKRLVVTELAVDLVADQRDVILFGQPGQRVTVRPLTDAEKAGDANAEPDTWFQLALRNPETRRFAPMGPGVSAEELSQRMARHLAANAKGMLVFNPYMVKEVLDHCAGRGWWPALARVERRQ